MEKITFPLTLQMQGSEVINLQTALELLVNQGIVQVEASYSPTLDKRSFQTTVLASMQFERSRYSGITQMLVRRFQEQHNLPVTGQIDEATAQAINNFLRELGVLKEPYKELFFTISGQVRTDTGAPFKGGLVRAFHRKGDKSIRLGEDITDAQGQYTIRYSGLPGVQSIHLCVVVFNANGILVQESDVIPEAKPLEVVELEVPSFAPTTYEVKGKVSSRVSASIGGLLVKIVDKTLEREVFLGQAFTNENGEYQVSFTDARLRQNGKSQPDLQTKVFRNDNLLATSAVYYNAKKREVLNVLLKDEAVSALQSEHETLISVITNQFNGSLKDLKETNERQDITYLANKTGWDARAVAIAALADQFSARTTNTQGQVQIAPPFFYALFRAGVPANENTLYQLDAETTETVWQKAIDQGVIPANLKDQLPQVKERFQALSAEQMLTSPAMVGVSSLKDILSISLNNPEDQERFAQLYTEHRGEPSQFWQLVQNTFGPEMRQRLQLDGQLGYLTINNAPLIRKLYSAVGQNRLTNAVNLVEQGYFRAENWQNLIEDLAVPKEVPGKDDVEKRANYSELLATQVRLSFPTAVVAQMVRSGETPLQNGAREQVHAFLNQHQGQFEIGMQPVEQYIARNNLENAPEVTQEVKRIQRVYQITPSERVMNTLLNQGLDSAYEIVNRYDRDEFVQTFKETLGGEDIAQLTYAKSEQVHNIVLNLTTSYLTTNRAPGIGPRGQFLNPQIFGTTGGTASDVIAYPTLEKLLGEMDYCTCEHCRSILSPAAYLVDLLLFCDCPINKRKNPQAILLSRRPDIQHLPLTCENTNTPLPYIDLVNETLEYYVTNNLSLTEYKGHSIEDDVAPEELLATPQFVSDTAYTTLANTLFPAPLPFNQPLENLRRYFNQFEISLSHAMKVLRKNDDIDRLPSLPSNDYAWRDILMEELHLSRTEYRLLSDRTLTLQQLYGFNPATSIAQVLSTLVNAKTFTRRINISYEDLIEILRTRFINPNSDLIPKLERLGVSFSTLKNFKDGTITDAQLDTLLKSELDVSQYGGDIKAWIKNDTNYANIMGLIVLINPRGASDLCRFDQLEFRYAEPDNATNQLGAFEYIRLIRFIRLWKRLGWTITQTDKAISALYPTAQLPNDADDEVNLQRLETGFLTLLPRLGYIKQVMGLLNLNLEKDLPSLLACFTEIDAHGMTSLYRQMFLSPALLKQDMAFADNGYGNFLTDTTQKLITHRELLRAAFLLTDNEFTQILTSLGFDATTPLSLDNISSIFRRGWLARKLKLSVQEFLLLTKFTGFDPFAAPDPVRPPILLLIEFANRLRQVSLKPVQALYLLWNQDISGKSVPSEQDILGFARSLRTGFTAIESEFALTTDPDGQIAHSCMALVYGNEVTDFFFGLLGNTLTTTVPYSQSQPILEQPILNIAPGRLAYDDFRKQLTFRGVLTLTLRDALKAVAGVTAQFKTAVDRLYTENQQTINPIFDRYPELQPFYAAYAFFGELKNSVSYTHGQPTLDKSILDAAQGQLTYDDTLHQLSYMGVLAKDKRDALKNVLGVSAQFRAAVDNLYTANQSSIEAFFRLYPVLVPQRESYLAANNSVEQRHTVLLANFLPDLKRRRKQQQAIQSISAAAKVDVSFASSLVDNASVLHAAQNNTQPTLNDLLALETMGLAAQFFFGETATGVADLSRDAEANLNYTNQDNPLPVNPVPANTVSGIWSGYLEAPENGFYNLRIEADTGATITLKLAGTSIPLKQNGTRWSNDTPIELRAGTLYAINLSAEKLKDTLSVRWQTARRGWEVIPSTYLYSTTLTSFLRTAYIRFLKVTSLAIILKLTANEVAYLAAQSSYKIGGQGWLNSLPVMGSPDNATSTALLKAFNGLLNFARIKADLSPGDERLLAVLKDPAIPIQKDQTTAIPNPSNLPFSLLFSLTRWETNSLEALRTHFGKVISDLSQIETFDLIYNAYQIVKQIGIPATVLIQTTTNEPTDTTVRNFQSALRARYDQSTWLQVLKPINDEMRRLQRDALVTYILHQMRSNPKTADIDTPDKLFEYFLMDVQMDPCMQTSRIRHALSSVQLFIERCLMNLEQEVSPSSFKSKERKQWEWMKRYRVWEANRKVFLYPENWLEPELRDDQSPFFKETMSELLQGDITEDRAAEVLLNYLTKLEEVAKLEPCGIHYLKNDDSQTAGDIAHVVARSTGASRKYFYRRQENGYWTPWEQIKLDIEDNPVLPVVWRDRLFLFWLRIFEKTPKNSENTQNNAPSETKNKKLAKITLTEAKSNLTNENNMTVEAILCWSEYFNGKWQPVRTSDIDKPLTLETLDPPFNRSELKLYANFKEGSLIITIFINEKLQNSFCLYNTHSSPKILVDNNSTISSNEESITAIHHPLIGNHQNAPFFYADDDHVFYVTTSQKIIYIPQWLDFGVITYPTIGKLDIPPLRLPPVKVIPDLVGPAITQPGFRVENLNQIERYITEDAYINRRIGSMKTVNFDDQEIGPSGSQINIIGTR
jgi:hypothetical protein